MHLFGKAVEAKGGIREGVLGTHPAFGHLFPKEKGK